MSSTVVKNTFLDVEDDDTTSKRSGRRTKTEPTGTTNAFAACMAPEESEDDSEEDEPQPSVAFTQTFDPFDQTPGGRGPAEGDTRAPVKSSSRTTPTRKVGFLSCGAEEESEEGEVDDNSGVAEFEQEVQPSISHSTTFDRFEAGSPQAAASAMGQHQQQPMQPMQPPPRDTMAQPMVFHIAIPAGMPVGMSHAVQLPAGLPPNSTIMVVAQHMGPTTVGVSSPRPATSSAPGIGSGALTAPPQTAPPVGLIGGGRLSPALGLGTTGPDAAGLGLAAAVAAGNQVSPQSILKHIGKNGALRVQYVVDARKLKANDKAVISPPFEISGANPGHYRIIVNPTFVKARGGATFKNSGGIGNVQLKCEDQSEGLITFSISIGDGRPNSIRNELARGPIEHNFADSSVCGLQKTQEEWDFNKAVDPSTKSFSVFLDIAQ